MSNNLSTRLLDPISLYKLDEPSVLEELFSELETQEVQATIQNKNDKGATALHLASESQYTRIVRVLLAKGAEIEAKDNFGNTPLLAVCNRPMRTFDFQTPWSPESVDTVEVLLKQGANIEARNELGRTPLHCACSNYHTETVKTLVANGADIHATDKDGKTPFDLAMYATDILETLVAHGATFDPDLPVSEYGWTPIFKASHNGDLKLAIIYCAKGANLSHTDKEGRTPLHVACYHGKPEVAEILLDNGAELDATAQDGWTALISACIQGHTACAKMLLARGAKLDLKDNDGLSAYEHALKGEHHEIVSTLKEHGSKGGDWSPKIDTCIPYEQLKKSSGLPKTVDLSMKECYLSNQEFEAIFKMQRDEFQALPKWKQLNLKKDAGLF